MGTRFRLYQIKTPLTIDSFSKKFIEFNEFNYMGFFSILEENTDIPKLTASFSFESEIHINQIDNNLEEMQKTTIKTLEKIDFDMYKLFDDNILLVIKNPIRSMNKFFDTLHKLSINSFSYKLVNINLTNVLKWLYGNYTDFFILNSFKIDNWKIEDDLIGEIKFKLKSNQNFYDINFLRNIGSSYNLISITIDITHFKFKNTITINKNGIIKTSKNLSYSYDIVLNNMDTYLQFFD